MSDNSVFENINLLKDKATLHIKEKKFSWAMVYLTDALQEIQKFVEQIENIDEMQKLIKEYKLPCHKNLSLCYLKIGNNESCIKQCKEVLQVEANNVKILYRLGSAQINLGEFEEAERNLQRAYLLDPNQKEIMKSLQKIERSKKNVQTMQKNQKGLGSGQKQSSSGILNIAKYLFLWPFILIMYCWRTYFQNKNKLN